MFIISLVTIFNLPVLFFIFGVFAKFVRSNLEIPDSIVKAVTLYLMMAIGIKGGVSLVDSPSFMDAFTLVFTVLVASFMMPTYIYFSFKRWVGIGRCGGDWGDLRLEFNDDLRHCCDVL